VRKCLRTCPRNGRATRASARLILLSAVNDKQLQRVDVKVTKERIFYFIIYKRAALSFFSLDALSKRP